MHRAHGQVRACPCCGRHSVVAQDARQDRALCIVFGDPVHRGKLQETDSPLARPRCEEWRAEQMSTARAAALSAALRVLA